tara:strand:+ start:227 stop:505 length:279 start_codon:yes stop_codon:yes gene_type:complete
VTLLIGWLQTHQMHSVFWIGNVEKTYKPAKPHVSTNFIKGCLSGAVVVPDWFKIVQELLGGFCSGGKCVLNQSPEFSLLCGLQVDAALLELS